ncbi:hypothetical protein EW146_g7909 [Bondarzewia mesenterica]|uniref:Uncharacterized protein n=1 Tax=Bondarzewia mesenterica TaxID=1095465 RepID=A0A4S4LIG6_9AGAM|nr:hypothetical protein EW146_g7909 [Bondarzewia mesenterica]
MPGCHPESPIDGSQADAQSKIFPHSGENSPGNAVRDQKRAGATCLVEATIAHRPSPNKDKLAVIRSSERVLR